MRKEFLEIGQAVGTHGVKGMLRVQPWADTPAFLSAFRRFYIDGVARKATAVTPHGNMVLVKLEQVDSIADAEKLRGKVLQVARADYPLPDGRYFVSELLDCKVYTPHKEKLLGVLSEVSETGANDVWHIENNGKEYLVPAIPSVIVRVDIDAGEIELDAMKGIFDDAD